VAAFFVGVHRGYRNFDTDDHSRNNWFVALIAEESFRQTNIFSKRISNSLDVGATYARETARRSEPRSLLIGGAPAADQRQSFYRPDDLRPQQLKVRSKAVSQSQIL